MAHFFQVVQELLKDKDAEIVKLQGDHAALRVKYDRLCIQAATLVDCMHTLGELIPMMEKMYDDDTEEEEADAIKSQGLTLLGQFKQQQAIAEAAEKMGKPAVNVQPVKKEGGD
jgi:hypothetical protein